jgi:AcrR family transcriptional regulator
LSRSCPRSARWGAGQLGVQSPALY